jgi:hypothetical protein
MHSGLEELDRLGGKGTDGMVVVLVVGGDDLDAGHHLAVGVADRDAVRFPGIAGGFGLMPAKSSA